MNNFFFMTFTFFIYGMTIEFLLVIFNVIQGYGVKYFFINISLSMTFSSIVIIKKFYDKKSSF